MCPAQAAARPGNDGHAPVKIDHLSLPSLLSLSLLQHPLLQLVLEACIADEGVGLPPSWTTIPSDSRSNVEENLAQHPEKDKPVDRQRSASTNTGSAQNPNYSHVL
jgi:hypothetical protein